MILRDYQSEAVEKTLEALRQGKHPVIALPTGSGKSLVIAALCQKLQGRILVLAHVHELLSQNHDELKKLSPLEDIGLYSAGLDRRDTKNRIIFAGVQSAYNKMETLQEAGPFDYCLTDESHLVNPSNSEAKQYNAVFTACANAQRVGLSATPFRLTDGPIFGPSPCWFDTLACQVSIRELTPEYLAPLRGILTAAEMPVDGVRSRMGDYITSELAQIACDEKLISQALDEACFLTAKRRKILYFCVDIMHAEMIGEQLNKRGIATGVVTGNTPKKERASIIESFRDGTLRALTNCQVLTTGFNVKAIDAIVLLRPTQSKGLLIQMLGRGTRQADGKRDCAVIDLAGNIERHAPIDGGAIFDIHRSPARVAADTEKKRKAEEKRARDLKHGTHASTADPMADDVQTITAHVSGVFYSVEPSKNPRYAGKNMVKVLYKLDHPTVKWCAMFLCNSYGGYAASTAQAWFDRRNAAMPPTAEIVVAHGKSHAYKNPESVIVRKEGKYWRIVAEQFEL